MFSAKFSSSKSLILYIDMFADDKYCMCDHTLVTSDVHNELWPPTGLVFISR
jgi:hypothetical protein